MVDKPIHSGQRHCGIREDARPFAKWMIGRNYQAAPFVTGSDQLEQDRGLGLILSHIAEVFEDEQVVFVELLDGTFQRQGLPSLLQTLHEIGRSGEQDPVAVLDERMTEGGAEVRLSRSAGPNSKIVPPRSIHPSPVASATTCARLSIGTAAKSKLSSVLPGGRRASIRCRWMRR